MSMAKQGAKAAVPRLRFPDFQNALPWNEKLLEDICTVNPSNDGLPNSFVYIDLESVEDGQLKAKNRIEKSDAPSRAQRHLRNGDVIFQVVRPYQRNNLYVDFDDGQQYVASTGYAQLRAKDSERFLYQAVHVDSFVEGVIAKCTGSNYPAINSSDLAEVRLFAPHDAAEQQKIADCLTSLDEVIAAQGRKVEALKAHKRGLMQQLFPREGETRPSLRFPGFRDAPEWAPQTLDAFIEEFREKSTVQDEYEVLTSARSGLIRQRDYYDNDRITERDNIGFNVIPPNHMTYRSRSDDRRFFFNENNLGITGIISTYYPVFRMSGGSNKFFIELLAQYAELVGKRSVGTSQTVLSLNELRRLALPVPVRGEQERIADCLSSLDTQIAAETQQLAALKTHKQGLMQQLFPAPEVAQA